MKIRKKAGNGEGSLFRKSRERNGKKVEYGSYKIQWRGADGKSVWENLGTKDYNTAQQLYHERVAQRLRGEGVHANNRETVKNYTGRWLRERTAQAQARGDAKGSTIKRYEDIVGAFLRFLDETGRKDLEMRRATKEDTEAFLTWRVKQTRFRGQSKVLITRKGANKEWKILRAVFKKAFRERILPVDFTREVVLFDIAKKRIRLPSPEEIEEVRDLIAEREARDVVTLLALSGMRPGEAFHLIWDHIDLDNKLMKVHPLPDERWTPKTKSSIREVPIQQDVEEILIRLRRERPGASGTDKVFLLPDGRPLADYPNFVYRRLTKAVKAANRRRRREGRELLPPFHNRTLRHFFISWSLNRKENPLTELEIIRIVGHVDFAMLRETYFHVDLAGHTGHKMRTMSFFTKSGAVVEAAAGAEGDGGKSAIDAQEGELGLDEPPMKHTLAAGN